MSIASNSKYIVKTITFQKEGFIMKKWIAIFLLVGILCGMLAGCKKNITADEAYQIVLKDMGVLAENAEAPHIHEGTYEDKPCYNIFITVGNGETLQYVVSTTGKILYKGIGEAHSH